MHPKGAFLSDLTRRFVSFVLAAALFGVGRPALAARHRRQIAQASDDDPNNDDVDDDSPLEPDDDDGDDGD